MSKNYLVTDQYCELEHKARLFADVFDYDSAIGEAHDVEVQHHGLPSLRQHAASGVRGQGEEAAHVGKVGQPVVVELVVQVVDGGLDLIAHPRERAGQRADLVSAVVVQVHVVVGVSQPLGGVGELLQRIGDDPHEEQHQYDIE